MDPSAIDVSTLKVGEKLKHWAFAAGRVEVPEGIGDVNGTDVGSGARFNTGKLRVDLLPLDVILNALDFGWTFDDDPSEHTAQNIREILASWQRLGDKDYLVAALGASIELVGSADTWTFEHFKECIKVLEYGTRKYAAWNWARGSNYSVPFGCALRHLDAIIRGEEIDPESGCSHMGHVTANIVFLLLYLRQYPQLNDMPFAVLHQPCAI